MRICVDTLIAAPPAAVWAAVRDIESHVQWMADAEEIVLTSSTTFDCRTRIGPFRLHDRMEIVEWHEGRAMGIRHVGLVRGTGLFTLAPVEGGEATHFSWEEELRFPWWLGGPVTAWAAKPVLRRVWRGNLRRLRALVEG